MRRSCDDLLLAMLEGMIMDTKLDAMPKPTEAEELGDGKVELRNEPREERGKEKEACQQKFTSVE